MEEAKEKISIYEEAKRRNIPMSQHESDLYLKVTSDSTRLINDYEFKCNVTTFYNTNDGSRWYDIPFAYDPFWNKPFLKK